MLTILSDLIAFRTRSGDPAETKACFDYIYACLSKSSMHITLHSNEGLPSIVATAQAGKHPKVLLQAHLDVVPAAPNFYKLSEKDGRLHGRGVFDMKFAAACYLKLVKDLKNELDTYDFGIMFTSDEEIGGENGVKYLLNNGYGADVCLLPDGGNNWQIETTCNAVWIIRVIASGKSAHGSRPWEGFNAINKLVAALSEIQDIFGALEPFKNSITVSKIHGGSALNQVPDHAEAVIDMRFINDKERIKCSKKIQKIIQSHELQLEVVATVKARSVDITQREIASFLKVAEQHIGKPIDSTHSFGASDACYFADHDIPTIVIRPTGDGAHSNHEWIDKAELFQFYDVIKTYITQTTKIR